MFYNTTSHARTSAGAVVNQSWSCDSTGAAMEGLTVIIYILCYKCGINLNIIWVGSRFLARYVIPIVNIKEARYKTNLHTV